MALNGISTATILVGLNIDSVATKLYRRDAKLALAQQKRSASGTGGYRKLNIIEGNHPVWINNTFTVSSGSASPVQGHPWSLVPSEAESLTTEDSQYFITDELGNILETE